MFAPLLACAQAIIKLTRTQIVKLQTMVSQDSQGPCPLPLTGSSEALRLANSVNESLRLVAGPLPGGARAGEPGSSSNELESD